MTDRPQRIPHPCPEKCGRERVYPPSWESELLPEELDRRCPSCHEAHFRSEVLKRGGRARIIFRAQSSGVLCVADVDVSPSHSTDLMKEGIVARTIMQLGVDKEMRRTGHGYMIFWWMMAKIA